MIKRRAFLKWDALMIVFITSIAVVFVLMIFNSLDNYLKSYDKYLECMNNKLHITYQRVLECCAE